jgi:hypothetical protein
LAVEQEIVPLNRCADRAGDQSTAQVRAVLYVGKRTDANFDSRHLGFPQIHLLMHGPVAPARFALKG